VTRFDVLARPQSGDGFLVSDDGNPNTVGARLLGVATGELASIAADVASGALKGLLVLGEDATQCGIPAAHLEKLETLVTMGILPDETTRRSNVILPSASWAEKRGSMINARGRIQRLNRAISSPGQARDDWENLRDLILDASGSNGIYSIEDVFKLMAAETPALAGLSLSKIGDLGIDLSEKIPAGIPLDKSSPPLAANVAV